MIQEQKESINIENRHTHERVEEVNRTSMSLWEKDGVLYRQEDGWGEVPPPKYKFE
jgi:hypothetical protein